MPKPLTRNEHWLSRSRAAVWHPCTQMKQHEITPLVPISRGSGSWLYDFDGHRYLDAISSWWVNLFGHGHPAINAAIVDQLAKLEHVMLAGFTHQPVVEIALKMSFHYWRNAGRAGKTNFVSVAHGYHGETVGALSVTDIPLFRDAYGPLLRHQAKVPSPDARLAPQGGSPSERALAAANALDAYLASNHEATAALIVEPMVQGAAGMAMHDPAYLTRVRELCTRYEVHLIADEIMTGFGRTGAMFACEHASVVPDMLCLSKGITGGYLPLSVVLTRDEIYEAFYDDDLARGFLHSHSYTGNALACRAALAVLDLFRHNDVLEANRVSAARLAELARPLAMHPKVENFRRLGMIWAFEVAIGRDGGRDDFARWFAAEALRREMLLRPIGRTVYWMPPYCLTPDEMEILASRTLEIVACA